MVVCGANAGNLRRVARWYRSTRRILHPRPPPTSSSLAHDVGGLRAREATDWAARPAWEAGSWKGVW
eukprot:scaffold11777_cov99-Isochrysis_galbana.AAC.6